MQPPFKLRYSKSRSVSSLTVVKYSSNKRRLGSGCAYAQAGLSLCWSHIPHCWKSHATAYSIMIRACAFDCCTYGIANKWIFWRVFTVRTHKVCNQMKVSIKYRVPGFAGLLRMYLSGWYCSYAIRFHPFHSDGLSQHIDTISMECILYLNGSKVKISLKWCSFISVHADCSYPAKCKPLWHAALCGIFDCQSTRLLVIRMKGLSSFATRLVHSKDSGQIRQVLSLILIFAGSSHMLSS